VDLLTSTNLLGYQVLQSNMPLFEGGVARQADCFHSIEQRWWNRVETICCGNEKDLAKVYRDIDVMVGKSVVLLRIKHFEHGCGRIAMEIRSPS